VEEPRDSRQTPRPGCLIAIGIVLFGWLHEIWLNWLFPTDWIAAAILVPILSALAVGAGIVVYGVLRIPRLGRGTQPLKAVLLAATVIALMWVQFSWHPSQQSPGEQMSRYWDTFQQYPDNTNYDHMVFGTHVQTIAAIVKYRDELPDSILVVQTLPFADKKYYPIEYRRNVPSYDHATLNMVDNGDTVTFIVNPGDPIYRRESTFKKPDVQAVVEGNSNIGKGYIYLFNLDELKGRHLTGADKLFMQMLKWFR